MNLQQLKILLLFLALVTFFLHLGKLLQDTLMQYKIPSRKDIGPKVNVIFSHSNEPTGPFGAKSIGEVVINTAAPAIADAVYKEQRQELEAYLLQVKNYSGKCIQNNWNL